MRTQLGNLLTRLWRDDCGAILTSEYMMLGTIAVLGSASGLVTLRDATNEELRGMGDSMRQVRQAYTPRQFRNPAQAAPGAAAAPQAQSGCAGTICP
ncbi:MAG: hypothetical protein L0Z62_02425 [Gemmataceae bacterium]|nr:hypothetical protein [Gemmataceae bacterium]